MPALMTVAGAFDALVATDHPWPAFGFGSFANVALKSTSSLVFNCQIGAYRDRQDCLSYLLGWGGRFRRGFLAIALVETIHASSRINQLLLAGKKWMASGADFNMQVALFR
jgi:hypothetical protein